MIESALSARTLTSEDHDVPQQRFTDYNSRSGRPGRSSLVLADSVASRGGRVVCGGQIVSMSAYVSVLEYIKANRGSHDNPDSLLLDMLLTCDMLGSIADEFEEFGRAFYTSWWVRSGDVSLVCLDLRGAVKDRDYPGLFSGMYTQYLKPPKNALPQTQFARRTKASMRAWIQHNRERVLGFLESRDGLTCAVCGSDSNLHIDHIQPLSRGGTNAMDNLQLLCAGCNLSKGAKTMKEWVEEKS